MPFSRSRSVESMTRSATSWLARKAPDCQSIASTSVVLPWSTWATIATLRRSLRLTSTPPRLDVSARKGGAPCRRPAARATRRRPVKVIRVGPLDAAAAGYPRPFAERNFAATLAGVSLLEADRRVHRLHRRVVSFALTALSVCAKAGPSFASSAFVLTTGATFWKPKTNFGSLRIVLAADSWASVVKTSARRPCRRRAPCTSGRSLAARTSG